MSCRQLNLRAKRQVAEDVNAFLSTESRLRAASTIFTKQNADRGCNHKLDANVGPWLTKRTLTSCHTPRPDQKCIFASLPMTVLHSLKTLPAIVWPKRSVPSASGKYSDRLFLISSLLATQHPIPLTASTILRISHHLSHDRLTASIPSKLRCSNSARTEAGTVQ